MYRETEGIVEQIVVDRRDLLDNEAKVTGSYTLDSEGCGYIVWEERPEPLPPLEETLVHVTAQKSLVSDN